MTRYGDARIMVDRYDGQTSVALTSPAPCSWTTAAWLGRPAYASFAVVDVPGQADCRFGSTERRSAGPTSKAASW